MVNAVSGRSFSTIVWAATGVTSVIQGEASSCRRNRVYAWMSTVRPLTSNWITDGAGGAFAAESTAGCAAVAAGCAAVAAGAGAAGAAEGLTLISQVKAG